MRRTLTGRVAAMCAGAVLIVGVVAGCSDDDSGGSEAAGTSSAAATSAAEATTDEATTQEITDAFVVFFNGKTPPAERVALIENGQAFEPILQGMTQDPQATQTEVAVTGVTVTEEGMADVNYDLLMQGNPVMPGQTGQAVEEDGTWKVSADTFCALLAVQGGADRVPDCV
ncbi:hypothetical protein VZC37_04145 [Gordonia sp. LSe1-13]|uniref:Low molecular weight antigen MTB12-like C-terminal domain-containing protein n=1 Tax=Gordonia sesuvii TaxID=3116777 RepID=A0ABU7M8R4_9ACTN|nr:hypothetical protein [Gordonia sp. LSe1-13]